MEIAAIPPTTPPAIGPAWLPLPERECMGSAVEDALTDGVLAEDVLAEDVYTPSAPKIAPGPYSGLSIIKRGCEIVTRSGKGT